MFKQAAGEVSSAEVKAGRRETKRKRWSVLKKFGVGAFQDAGGGVTGKLWRTATGCR